MKLIKGMIIGAAAGYAYANSVPKDKRKEQMDRIVTSVKDQTRPVTEAVSTNVRSLADTATNRVARTVDDAGTAAEEKLDDDTTGARRPATISGPSAANGSVDSLDTTS